MEGEKIWLNKEEKCDHHPCKSGEFPKHVNKTTMEHNGARVNLETQQPAVLLLGEGKLENKGRHKFRMNSRL